MILASRAMRTTRIASDDGILLRRPGCQPHCASCGPREAVGDKKPHDQIDPNNDGCHNHAARLPKACVKRKIGLACLPVGAALIASGCGAAGPQRVPPRHWLAANPAKKSVVLRLLASGSGESLGAFNGYSRGQVLVKIPTGWRVTVRCKNTSMLANQSCAIAQNSLSTGPAFPGAATPDPLVGLPPGRSASFTFLASRPGVYRIASLVDNEQIANGMWDTLQVGGTSRPSATLYLAIR